MSDSVARLNAALEGRYAIERELGEGGMATVYLADDLKHERKVALKVLKPELAAVVGAERFLAEIKTTANLTHPHVLPLHDSGEADGFLFYVMPYLEGETLRDRIDREKQLPVDEAVALASKVAGALQHAHEHGVIHRDIKPGNILLQDGEPVVSDFGIALALGVAGGTRLTETGLSVGTPFYMSPEQATGEQAVGASPDTYALGAVLYEMLVGEPPYPGTTAQAVLGKIIAGKGVWATEHRPSIPANVDAALRKALEKLPADRFTSAQEFVRALADPGFRHGEPLATGSFRAEGLWNPLSVGATVLALALAATSLWLLRSVRLDQAGSESEVVRFPLTPPSGALLSTSAVLAISPDGRTLLFSVDENDLLLRHDLDELEPTPIPGTENAWMPFFSPDGEWIGFFDDVENTLQRVRLDGTELQSLGPAPSTTRSAGWSEDGTIVFNSSQLGGLARVRPGADIELIENGVGNLWWLDLLPGAEAVLGGLPGRALSGGARQTQVVVVPLDTGEPKVLFPGHTPRYVDTGHIIYWRDGSLWARPFDLERLEANGQPTLIVEGVYATTNAFAHYAVNEELLVYRAGGFSQARFVSGTPVWVDRAGNEEPLAVDAGDYSAVRVSPDGTQVALVRFQGNEDIWILDLRSDVFRQLTLNPAADRTPIWTPDSQGIVFSSDRDGSRNLYMRRADGSDRARRLTTNEARQIPHAITGDGSTLLFEQFAVASRLGVESDLWSLSLESDGEPVPLMQEDFAESRPTLSADGRFIAFQSSELGYPEVIVQSFPELSGSWMVSTLDLGLQTGLTNADPREARSPKWSGDGTEIIYRSGPSFVSVPVLNTEGPLDTGTPQELFAGQWVPSGSGHQYDVSPNGRRLLILKRSTGTVLAPSDEIIVVTNWFEELRQRMGN